MMPRILLCCLLVALFGAGSALSCRWLDEDFKRFSKSSLDLLSEMSNNSTNSTEDTEMDEAVVFPIDLYRHAAKASAEDKVSFAAHVLYEAADLLDQDYSRASWEERKVQDFLNIVMQQADGLRSCAGKHNHKKMNKKLQLYFSRLSVIILEQQGFSAESWELIRMEIKIHLQQIELLLSPLIGSTN